MKIYRLIITSIMALSFSNMSYSEDWDGIPVPVDLDNGESWELQTISESFNYTAGPTDKPEEFTKKWVDSFINPWLGPGLSEFNSGHSFVTGGALGIAANRKEGTDKVYTGVISSKETFTYPLYIEAMAKVSNLVLASNVWMLSADSTEEIDIMEAYGSDRPGQEWFAHRMHLSHHVFIRDPFQDYQPTDEGSWYFMETPWRYDFHRIGVYWRDPWHLEYYIDGELVRTVSGEAIIDPEGYTNGTGLSKPMHIIINTEDQDWRSDAGITPTDEELADDDKSIVWIDWLRVYKPSNDGSSPTPPDGKISLEVRSSKKCVDLKEGSSLNGANIQQWACGENNNNQDFEFVSKADDWYEIKTKHNKCVGVKDASNANGANIQQWECFEGGNLQFKPIKKQGDWFELRARHSDKCLDIEASSSTNGTNIQQWQCTGGNNQLFRFK
ncbi:RICIN domain-containing protein [Agarilytica rhodophyticola]|uniref:RICIN domain-containing protein n=1 Tax=Agarilytica rhodophyticola TaxID=1737490 RepID=UPI000B347C30|nr:RICIN domain-containing protein [Agarilytica rhodophyticola]